jgi:F420-dependent oxidoreductase-like protein
MRFAFKTIPQHTTWADMLAVWQVADEIELYESAWNFDHFYPIFGNTDHAGPCLEAWSMLAAMAQATNRIRVGCQVTGMVYRHPAVLANMAATVDIISGGRLELGLGAGWNEEECGAYGIALPPLKERFDRFDEGVQAIIGLLSQETTTLDGAYVRLTEARCEPKPVQRPHPPITIGGSGPTRTLRAVALWAQQWNAITSGPDDWLAKRAVLQQRCDEVGRDIAEITCSVNVRYAVGDDLAPLVDQVAAYADAGVDLIVVGLVPPHDAGVVEPIAKALAPLAQVG